MNQKEKKVRISLKAANAVRESLIDQGLPTSQTRLRIGANKGGCSGWRWELETEDSNNESEHDLVFESEGLELIVDSDILENVIGSVLIDYSTKNLVEQGFVFIRESGQQCGCGESMEAINRNY